MRRGLPTGTVTFLFTDVEQSTKLLHELGAQAYAEALGEHRHVVRTAVERWHGVEVDTQGDAFLIAFGRADDAVAAADEIRDSLADGPIRLRMGIHTGEPHLTTDGYVGTDVHLGARIAGAGHGGQVLLSRRTADDVKATASRRDVVELVALGEHRLKDFAAAVEIFQLGVASFPPLRTIANTNLPRPASSFVGRTSEVAAIVARLQDGTRLMTLTGPGGSGKTRVAIEAAVELIPRFRAGVFWVGLAPVRDPALVSSTIARTIGAGDDLPGVIGERDMLLVVDNLEQVIDAGRDLAGLVETCPNLRVLATSRERLRVRGEVELAVEPLADPDAVRLFADRSRLPVTDDAVRLVRALDNLPLAVELAAARTHVLTPGQILDRLAGRLDLLRAGRDADPRQSTLRATIAWSYELLEPAEAQLFARLAIFRGGWTLDTAEAVADATVESLGALVDKSLVQSRDGRFSMLETVREFATERLVASAERDELVRRHAVHFLAMAEQAAPHLRGSPEPWLARLDLEHDNLRAALDGLEEIGAVDAALQLAGALQRFWAMRGHMNEGRTRLERLLEVPASATPARARALTGAAMLLLSGFAADDTATTAAAYADAALAIFEAAGDAWGSAHARFLAGCALIEQRRYADARDALAASEQEFTSLGDDHYVLLASRNLAWARFELGDVEGARAGHEEVVRRARSLGNVRMQATSLGALAEYDLLEGHPEPAEPQLRESTELWWRTGEVLEIAVNLARFAYLFALRGEDEPAARLLGKADAIEVEAGTTTPGFIVELNAKTAALLSQRRSADELERAIEAGRALTVPDALDLVGCAHE